MKKKVLAVILTVAILSSIMAVAVGAVSVDDFTDVDSSDWFYDEVDFVSEEGYMIGVSSTEFAPEDDVTRAMFVTILSRVAEVEVDDSVSSFSDVPVDTWYTGAVAWAVEAGITEGVDDDAFDPDSPVTRQDMATFMDRFVEWYSDEYSKTHSTDELIESFTDEDDISSYAVDSVEACREWGLITGYTDGSFGPLNNSTRAEVATVISRLHWLVKSSSSSGGSSSSSSSSDSHTITVSLARDPAITVSGVTVSPELEATFKDNATVTSIATLLVTDENETALKSYISNALESIALTDNVQDFTFSYSGTSVTITATADNLTISATLTAPMSFILSTQGVLAADTSVTLTEVTADTVEELITRIESEGAGSVTVSDLLILNTILNTEINEDTITEALESASATVQSLVSDSNVDDLVEQVQDYVDDVISPIQKSLVDAILEADDSIDEDALSSSNSDTLTEALESSEEDLSEVSASEDAVDSDTISANSSITVTIDIPYYLDILQNEDSNAKENYVTKVANYLDSVDGEKSVSYDDLKEFVDVLCDISSLYTDNEDGSITLSDDEDDYYDYIVDVKDAFNTLYTAIGGDSTFYSNVITNAVRIAENAGFTVTITDDQISTLATILGANKVSHSNANSVGELSASISVSDSYETLVDYIANAQYTPATIANAIENYAPESFDSLPAIVQTWLQGTFTASVSVD